MRQQYLDSTGRAACLRKTMVSKADHPVGEHLEEDLKRIIAYLNDRVVPEVRQNSSKALRIAAEQLNRLATHLDRRQGE
jgi:bisphosphoglycerate-dependent phosphoglycerate mutase